MTDLEQSARLIRHCEGALGQALSGLIGKDFIVRALDPGHALPLPESPYIWEQTFSLSEGPAVWMAADKDVWEALSRMTLDAAGVDDATESDLRSTWQEIIGQSMAGIANGLTADMLREVTASAGKEVTVEPAGAKWTGLTITQTPAKTWTARIAWSPALLAVIEGRPREMRSQAGNENKVSKTFDILLDVSLPVSVSFGKTALQIREVLKLNSGSIVELNRLISDPVDVVVNDCVIARGEVVVVDGNYGVRINHLASREDRLRSGMVEASAIARAGR